MIPHQVGAAAAASAAGSPVRPEDPPIRFELIISAFPLLAKFYKIFFFNFGGDFTKRGYLTSHCQKMLRLLPKSRGLVGSQGLKRTK